MDGASKASIIVVSAVSSVVQFCRNNKLAVFGTSLGIALISTLYILHKHRTRKWEDIHPADCQCNQCRMDRVRGVGIMNNHSPAHSTPRKHTGHAPPPPPAFFSHAGSRKSSTGRSVGSATRSHRQGTPERGQRHREERGGTPSSRRSDAHSDSISSIDTLMNESGMQLHNLSVDQLSHAGWNSFRAAMKHWDSALKKLQNETDEETSERATQLHEELTGLLQKAHQLENDFHESLASNAAIDAALLALREMNAEYEQDRQMRGPGGYAAGILSADTGDGVLSDAGSTTDADSFISATDLANLADLDTHNDMLEHLALYRSALLELRHAAIPCRVFRTQLTACISDTEFLAKLHCLRVGMPLVLDQELTDYLQESSRELLADLLVLADKDPSDFYLAYDEVFRFVKDKSNWPKIQEELRYRGVTCMTFYDIVLDFILLDAFDDLAAPPSSLIAVIQNRWLSDGFKERALVTAVWSVLKVKRSTLRFGDGFIGRFYNITEQISPTLAWGFLGPPSPLQDVCFHFKDEIMALVQGLFSFHKCHYDTAEHLAGDIRKLALQCVSRIQHHLRKYLLSGAGGSSDMAGSTVGAKRPAMVRSGSDVPEGAGHHRRGAGLCEDVPLGVDRSVSADNVLASSPSTLVEQKSPDTAVNSTPHDANDAILPTPLHDAPVEIQHIDALDLDTPDATEKDILHDLGSPSTPVAEPLACPHSSIITPGATIENGVVADQVGNGDEVEHTDAHINTVYGPCVY